MKKLLIASLLTLIAGVAAAQDFRTGYFLDNYVYSYRINPGASLDGKPCTFFGVGVSNISLNANSNLSFSSFLNKNMDMWFYDSRVPVEEVLTNFDPKNSLQLNANVNVLTFGRQTDHNRFSVELNVRSDSYFNLPYEAISSTKEALAQMADGFENGSFVFSDLQANANLYTEVAFGYTQKLGDALTVGGRLKGLVGLADVSANLSTDVKLNGMHTSDELVSGTMQGDVAIASPVDLDFERTPNGQYDLYLTDYEALIGKLLTDNHRKVAGWGAAIDLGVNFEPFEGLNLNASLLDVGFIRWNSTIKGKFSFDKTIKTGSGNENIPSEIFALEDTGETGYVSALNYTAHAGATYRLPFYNQLSVGVIGTVQKHYKELRLGANLSPLSFLSIAASGALTSFGPDFGLALNLRLPILNFYIGADSLVLPGTREAVLGRQLNTMVTTGLVITI